MRPVRVVVHDYAGHVGQIEVARELARRGFEVTFLYAAGLETPRGDLTTAVDGGSFEVRAVDFGSTFQKHNYFRRQLQEMQYGGRLVRAVMAASPDIVLSANTPAFPQAQLQRACARAGIPFIFWMTDMYGLAVRDVLRRRMGVAGAAIGRFYMALERSALRRSDGVIVIAERFKEILAGWRLDRTDIVVIPVCAPFGSIGVGAKSNAWSLARGLGQAEVVLYSGTLGHKHNPGLIVAVAEALRGRAGARVLVISEGPGADFVRAQASERGLDNLTVLPFQPFEALGEVLATADVLLAILEPDAAEFSLPSKVLSHLCAGRAQVVAVSGANAVAKMIRGAACGRTVAPDDEAGFVRAVVDLLDDSAERQRLGGNGRAYAEETFGVHRLGDDYVAMIERLIGAPCGSQGQAAG